MVNGGVTEAGSLRVDSSPEMRLAVAMNGGVSLAVWIGGVAYELWRFTQDLGPWANNDLPANARIDVLSGTSADGINAVLLALGSLYPYVEVDGRPAMVGLRDLWLDDAGLEPAKRAPPGVPPLLREPVARLQSLLDGEHFLGRLRHAVGLLVPSGASNADGTRASHELDLQLTATSLRGAADDVVGDDGEVFRNRAHASCFHFRHGLGGRDDFAFANDDARQVLVDALARAARSTASFPFAFEPSVLDRAEQAELLVGAKDDTVFVDGGVLNNLPIGRAIDAIFQMPAGGQVSRYLVVVVPDPPAPSADDSTSSVSVGTVPDVSAVVLDSVLGIPRTQSVADVLRELRVLNGSVEALRDARSQLFDLHYDKLADAADALWPSYQANRRTQTASQLAEGWARARPDQPHHFGHFRTVAAEAAFPWLHAEWQREQDHNPCWGASMLRRMAATMFDLIGRARAAGVEDLRDVQEQVHDIRRRADLLNPLGLGTEQLVDSIGPEADFDLSALEHALDGWPHVGETGAVGAPGDRRTRLGELLTQLGDGLATLSRRWLAAGVSQGPPVLVVDGATVDPHRVLCALEVTQYAFRDFAYTAEQTVKVALLSPRMPCVLDPQRRSSAARKLAGDELGHFGAFLKRSWRANDWMWGRLDAAAFVGSLLWPDSADRETHVKTVQANIVEEEAPGLCRAVQEDHARGARNVAGRKLIAVVPGAAQTFDSWPEVKANLGIGGIDEAAASTFLGLVEIGDETVSSEYGTTLIARVGSKAAATTARILRGSALPGRSVSSGVLAPLAGLATGVYRYTRSVRPVGVSDDKARGWFLAACAAVLGPAAVGLAGLFGVDLGVAVPVAWLVLIGVLLGAALIAPATTALLSAIAGVSGLLATLPESPPTWLGEWVRSGDGWRWSWLPLTPWIAVPVIMLALAAVPSRIVSRLDDRWWQMRKRAQETVEAWRQP